ncbi:MAG: amino acid permease [bacterium]
MATVAGEIKVPGKNLPLAMVGSVLIVRGLYVLAILICNSVYSYETLSELRGTALIEVSSYFFGTSGRITLMLGGLLVTLSSANSYIMSSSLALYALSKDSIVPDKTTTVLRRFGTPPYFTTFNGGQRLPHSFFLVGRNTGISLHGA